MFARGQQSQNYGSRGLGAGGGPIGMVVKGLATGVGLAAEGYHHHKEKKKAKEAQQHTSPDTVAPPSQPTSHQGERAVHEVEGEEARDAREPTLSEQHEFDTHMSRQMNEAAWQLDEAQDEATQPERPPNANPDPDRNDPHDHDIGPFLQAHPLPPAHTQASPGHLDMPVVITQRRPGTRTRGFVRAYAPALEEAGIDEPTFLDFVDRLNAAVEPSPWIQAINLASLAGNAVPEPFTQIIAVAVKLVADAAAEAHSRTRTNRFLDEMNESFFAPRGLVALVMTWRPERPGEMVTSVDFNMNASIVKASSAQGPSKFWKDAKHSLQKSSGASSFEFPQMAPLVFPVLDEIAASDPEDTSDNNDKKKKQSALKNGGEFVGQYLDKRARAKWAGENPDSKMATAAPKEEFHSRYADPNHPASSGDPIAFLTGGYLHSFGGLNALGARRDMRFGGGGIEETRAQRGYGGVRGRADMEYYDRRGYGSQLRGLQAVRDRRVDLLGGRGDMGCSDQRTGASPRETEARGLEASGSRGLQVDRGHGYGGDSPAGRGIGGSGIGPLSLAFGAKKLLQKDVLYLMIVQRPTEEQLATAEASLASYRRS